MRAYKGRYTYLFTLCAARDIIAEELPTARDIFKALVPILCENGKGAYISDSFTSGFICKPMYYDTVKLSNIDDFKLFKKIKSAKYEETDLVMRDIQPEKIPQMIREQRLIADDEYIYSASSSLCESFSRYVDPARKRPLVMKVKEGALIDFYISTKSPVENLQGEQIRLCDGEFGVCQIKKTEMKAAERYMLTADLETSSADTDSAKIFRLKYSIKEKKQYFARGSIFSFDVFSNLEERAKEFIPFFLPV